MPAPRAYARGAPATMSSTVKNIVVVILATLISRLTGLVRDSLMFSLLGAGGLCSAFVLAFTIPNLFRRLLGEGALTSAVVPLFTEELQDGAKEGAFKFLNKVLSRLLIVLSIIVLILLLLITVGLWARNLEPRWYDSMRFGLWLMPYLGMVCLAAIIASALNVLDKFGAAAVSPVWLNMTMIGALVLFGCTLHADAETIVYGLCVGVLVGGFLQLVLPALALTRQGWQPRWDFEPSRRMHDLLGLFVPGALGAAVIQINTAVVRLLAFGVNESGVSILYVAARLIELPIGMFAIAITTVLFPKLAASVARQDDAIIHQTYHRGLRMIFTITIPAAIGLVLLAKPIVQLLFQWGKFGTADVATTVPILSIYALTIPFYAWATFVTRGFHALKDTRTPVKVSLALLVLNLIFALSLVKPLGVAGLACANLLTVTIQCGLLQYLLKRRMDAFRTGDVDLKSIGIACTVMIMVVLVTFYVVQSVVGMGKVALLLNIFVTISSAVGAYAWMMWRRVRYLI